MPTFARGNRRATQSGSILVDAVLALMVVSVLGVAVLASVGESYRAASELEKGLQARTAAIGAASKALW